jgi:hypothetical protein
MKARVLRRHEILILTLRGEISQILFENKLKIEVSVPN